MDSVVNTEMPSWLTVAITEQNGGNINSATSVMSEMTIIKLMT